MASDDRLAGSVLFAGMITKRGRGQTSFGRKNWKDRYLILTEVELSYWDKFWNTNGVFSPDNGAVKKGKIPVSKLRSVEAVPTEKFDRELVFKVTHDDDSEEGAELYIGPKKGSGTSAGSGDAREAWITQIRSAIAGPAMRSPSQRPLPDPHANGAAAAAAAAGPPLSTPRHQVRRGNSLGDPASSPDHGTSVRRHVSLPADGHQSTPSPAAPPHSRGGSFRSGGPVAFQREPWFAAGKTAHDTAAALMKQGEGAFFVRVSSTVKNAFTLDIRTMNPAEPVVSKRILKTGAFYVYEGDTYEHVSLVQCISACSDYKVNLTETSRAMPVPKPRPRPSPGQAGPAGASPRGLVSRPSQKVSTMNTRNIRSAAEMEEEIYGTVGPRDDVEEVDYKSLDAAAPPPPVVPPKSEVIPGAIRAKNKLWKDRPDVVAAKLVDKLTAGEVKRQEIIYEFVYSEEAYLNDINGLLKVYISRIKASALTFGENPTFLSKFEKSVSALRDVCQHFFKAMQRRQAEAPVVERIADVVLDHIHSMAPKYFEYFEIVPDCKDVLKRNTAGPLADVLSQIRENPESRGLTMDSYSLVAVQRMIRYPMLIQECLKKTSDEKEQRDLEKVYKLWQERLQKCNNRMGEVNEWYQLRDWNTTFDYSKLVGYHEIWTPDMHRGSRTVVKTGVLELVKLHDNKKKIVKRKEMEVMLLSDMFLYCKALKDKKTGAIRKVVYKMAHRSLIEAAQFYPDFGAQDKLKDIVQVTILSEVARDHEIGKGAETIYFKAKDTMEKERWIEAFNPQRDDEDIYQAWDCPEYVVIEDWNPPLGQTDSMPLRKGERLIVEKKGAEWMKGKIKFPPPFPSFRTSGYFPATKVTEISSFHHVSKRVKNLHARTTGGKRNSQFGALPE